MGIFVCDFIHLWIFTFALFLFLHGLILQSCWLSTNWWHVELVLSLFGYIFYFPLLFGFIFISSYKYSFVYILTECVHNWTLNKLEILFKWEEEFSKCVLIKQQFLIKESFIYLLLFIKIQKNAFRKIQKKLFLMTLFKNFFV